MTNCSLFFSHVSVSTQTELFLFGLHLQRWGLIWCWISLFSRVFWCLSAVFYCLCSCCENFHRISFRYYTELISRCRDLHGSRCCGSVLAYSIQVCAHAMPRGKDICNLLEKHLLLHISVERLRKSFSQRLKEEMLNFAQLHVLPIFFLFLSFFLFF